MPRTQNYGQAPEFQYISYSYNSLFYAILQQRGDSWNCTG